VRGHAAAARLGADRDRARVAGGDPVPGGPLEEGDELLFVAVQDAEADLRRLVCGDDSC
jgi:hypothetical protein